MEKLEELLNREPGSARIQALIREREDYQADLLRLIDAQQGPEQDEVDPITGLILSSPNINHGALLANLYSGLNDGSSPMLEDDPRRPIRRYRAVKKADLGREAYHQFKTELIKSVEAAPPLWDLTNPSHHRREIKNVLWAKIAQRLGQKFHVQCTRADIEENWRSIKDTWLRKRREENMRKKAGFPLDEIPQAAQWVYWDMLSFLNKPRNACEKAGLATNLRQYGKKLPEIVAQKLSKEGQNPNNASQRSCSVSVPSAEDGLEPPSSKRPHFDGAESLDQDGEGPSGSADVANFMSFILPRGEDAEESAHAVVDDEDYMEDDLEDSTDFPTNKMTPSASHSQTDSPSKASGSGSKPATHVNKSVKSGSVAQNGRRGPAATALPNGQMNDSRAPRATTSAEEVDMWGRVLAALEQPRLRSTFTLCNEKFEEMSKKNPRLAADFEMEILTLVMKYSQKLHEK